jgi:5-methylcytosine-specific restriction endonuclease McrA
MSSMDNLPIVSEQEENNRNSLLVNRTNVPSGLHYRDYRKYLRYDFFFTCAYCSISEAEAQAIRFTIDHYEPRAARDDLEHEYSNLMYACDECNQRKGDRSPPPNARADGYRFYRPDEDFFNDHFKQHGVRVEPKSHTGEYSIEALDLNRLSLRRLRELRQRLTECHKFVAEGVLALREFSIDRLPKNIKVSALNAIRNATKIAEDLENEIDSILRDYARSSLIDDDPEQKDRAIERTVKLKQLEALHPGTWRAPRKKRKGRS